MTSDSLRSILRVNLGVKKAERVLLFTDRPSRRETLEPEEFKRRQKLRDLALIAADSGQNLCREIIFREFPATGSHGVEPPEPLWRAAFGDGPVESLKGMKVFSKILRKRAASEDMASAEAVIRKAASKAVDAVVALSNFSTSHTRFRDLLTRVCGARYASMPLFDVGMLDGPMNIDWKELEKRTKRLARVVNSAETVEVRTPNGTRISFSKKGRRALSDTGIIRKPGSFSNLPAGEVFLAPLEGTARGRLVLEWAPTRKLSSPVTLTVKEGNVTEVSGDEAFVRYLDGKLDERPENRNIAELGIGTNDRARRPDNILESEKIMGTVHFALGDNSTFGGRVKAPFHQDFVFFKPTIHLFDRSGSKTTIMRRGKFLEGIAG